MFTAVGVCEGVGVVGGCFCSSILAVCLLRTGNVFCCSDECLQNRIAGSVSKPEKGSDRRVTNSTAVEPELNHDVITIEINISIIKLTKIKI